MPRVGTSETALIVLRGNSGSGKSTVAATLRSRFGHGLAIIEQDYVRRVVCREDNGPAAVNNDLIDLMARKLLDERYHVVVEGILHANFYEGMLARLLADHRGDNFAGYFDVPLEETLVRHRTKPLAVVVPEDQVRSWYAENDRLSALRETNILMRHSPDQVVDQIYEACPSLNLPSPFADHGCS